MTRLLIDLSDVLDQTHPDDAVTVWPPALREGVRGQIVNTRRQKISLVDGKGEATVEPGPLMVQIYSPGARQKDATRLTIPDQAEVTLTAAMEGQFAYTPAIVTAVSALRDEAVAAAATVGDAQTVLSARDQAVQAAAAASTAASTAAAAAVAEKADTGFGDVVDTIIAGDFNILDLSVAGLYRIRGGTGHVANMPLTTAGLWWNVVLVSTMDPAGANAKLYFAHSTTSSTVYCRVKYNTTWGAWTAITTAMPSAMTYAVGMAASPTSTGYTISALVLQQVLKYFLTGSSTTAPTVTGQSVMVAADVAAARTALGAVEAITPGLGIWKGTQAEYDALPAATRNAATFMAAII